MELKQDLYINNKEKKQVIILFQKQAKKLKKYKKMIDKLQNIAIVKPNITLLFIKKFTYHHYLAFTYALFLQANISIFNQSKQPIIQSIYTYSKNSSNRFKNLPRP